MVCQIDVSGTRETWDGTNTFSEDVSSGMYIYSDRHGVFCNVLLTPVAVYF